MTKQRLTFNGSTHHDDRLISNHLKPSKKVFRINSVNISDEKSPNQLSRYIQDDNNYLRDNQQSKLSTY